MGKLSSHLRNAFLAGALAVVPIAVTAFVIWYVETKTRSAVRQVTGHDVAPFLGVLLAIALIYLIGVAVTSLVGRVLIRWADRVLNRLPLVRTAYAAWKQIALTPGGGQGMYAQVVLVGGAGTEGAGTGATEGGGTGSSGGTCGAVQIGFTSGTPVPGADHLLPVFLPQCPNPLNGRLLLVPRVQCRATSITPEEAFKMLLSSGNYVPPGLAGNA